MCGTEDGILDFFNWNEWGNISDRFPGHKMSIDAIVPLSDQIVATADSEAIRYSMCLKTIWNETFWNWQKL